MAPVTADEFVPEASELIVEGADSELILEGTDISASAFNPFEVMLMRVFFLVMVLA